MVFEVRCPRRSTDNNATKSLMATFVLLLRSNLTRISALRPPSTVLGELVLVLAADYGPRQTEAVPVIWRFMEGRGGGWLLLGV